MIVKDTFRNQFTGLSTDDWSPDTNETLKSVANGDVRFDMDTGDAYMWDADAKDWILL